MKKYNRDNCNTCIRAQVTDQYGRIITLAGTHAFEWSVSIEAFGKITISTFPKSKEAKLLFNKLKRKR